MEVKKIVEGMTATQVAQVIDENFNALNGEKATVEAVADVQKNVNRSDDNTGVLYYQEYSSTEPVAVGDVRRYEGLLYRAKEAGAHDWDPEKWERVTLKQLEDEKLSELGSEVGNYTKKVNETYGSYIVRQGVIAEIPVSAPEGTSVNIRLKGDAKYSRIVGYVNKVNGVQVVYDAKINNYYTFTVGESYEKIILYGIGSDGYSGSIDVDVNYTILAKGVRKEVEINSNNIENLLFKVEGGTKTLQISDNGVIDSSSVVALWFKLPIKIPKGKTANVDMILECEPSRVVFYENKVESANLQNLPVVSGSFTYTAMNDVDYLYMYGSATVKGFVSISVSYTEEYEGLIKRTEYIDQVIGESDKNVDITNGKLVNTIGFNQWFDIEVNIAKGSLVRVVGDYECSPTRVLIYENKAGGNQHDMSLTKEFTEFVAIGDITKLRVYGTATVEGNVSITVSYIQEGFGVLKDVGYLNKEVISPLIGKKMAFLGSSITQGKAWCKYVAMAFDSEYVNCGVGGTAIVNESDASMSNPKRLTGEYSNVTDPNTGEITANGVALPIDSEIIIIEGGVNDWARNWPLGDRKIKHTNGVLDVDDQTFYGACHQTFSNILGRCPNAIIIAVGDVFGKMPNRSVFTDKYGLYNNQGLLITDYADALVDAAGMWGFRAFNFGRFVGVNDANVMSMGDGLHPNDNHNHRIANAIINFLKEVKSLEVY